MRRENRGIQFVGVEFVDQVSGLSLLGTCLVVDAVFAETCEFFDEQKHGKSLLFGATLKLDLWGSAEQRGFFTPECEKSGGWGSTPGFE